MVLKRNVAYFGLNLLGIVACIYSLHVEISKANDKGYVAMCDLSYRASCSKVVTSDYAKGFGIIGPLLGEDSFLNVSNAAYGILLYIALIATGFVPSLTWASVVMQLLGLPVNFYLLYVMLVVLGDVCLVCSTLYTINFSLLGVSLYRWHTQCSPRTAKPHHS